MKKKVYAIMIGAALALTAADTTLAMSELVSLSTTPMWPASSTPDGKLLYYVTTVGRGGAGLLEVTLTASDLPPGVTATFSPEVLRFTGTKETSQTAVMTVQCPELMPIDCYPFTLTGTALRESLTVTNQVMLTPEQVAARAPTVYLDKWDNGSLRLRGLGATGRTYQIDFRECQEDPVWKPLGYSTADGNGRFTFFTMPDANIRICHLRAVLPATEAAPQE